MTKLFALEDDSSDANDLLIDKVLARSKQPQSPLSLTADLLKQRQQLQEEITDKLQEPSGTPQDPSEDTPEPTPVPQEDEPPQDSEEDTQAGKPKDDSKEPAGKAQDKTSTDDETDAASSEDGLNDLIGSGLSGSADKKDEKKDDKQPAQESFRQKPAKATVKKVTLASVFSPILDSHRRYTQALEMYALEEHSVQPSQQPIVYVKDSVKQALMNLVDLSNTYIQSNETFLKTIGESAKNLNERVTVFKSLVDAKKYQFTHKLVTDKDILANVSVEEESDPRATVKILLAYLADSTQATTLAVSNEFSSLASSYANANYEDAEDDKVYKHTLPGFNLIRLHLPVYKNYLNTNLQDYQYYKLKVLKTEDLYKLNAIALTEDKELAYLIGALDKLLAHLAMSVDNLSDITQHFTTLIDQIKVMIYDVEQDKHKSLADLDIDGKVQDFIRFKLAIETHYIDINLIVDYMTGLMSVLNLTVELTD